VYAITEIIPKKAMARMARAMTTSTRVKPAERALFLRLSSMGILFIPELE